MAYPPAAYGVSQCAGLVTAHGPTTRAGNIIFSRFCELFSIWQGHSHSFDQNISAKNTDSVWNGQTVWHSLCSFLTSLLHYVIL